MLQRHQALKRYRYTHYTLHILDCDFTSIEPPSITPHTRIIDVLLVEEKS